MVVPGRPKAGTTDVKLYHLSIWSSIREFCHPSSKAKRPRVDGWPEICSKVELGHQTAKRSLGLTGRMA